MRKNKAKYSSQLILVRDTEVVIQKTFEFLFGRNGLRPSRFYVTKDNMMVMASEVGVYDTPPSNVVLKVNEETNT